MRFASWIWGIFFILAAALVIYLQFGGPEIGITGMILLIIALIMATHCIAVRSPVSLPLALALAYWGLQVPFELYYIQPWTLILAGILASIGLLMLLPRKKWQTGSYTEYGCRNYERGAGRRNQVRTEHSANENNPSVNVHLGAICRYLHADALETVNLRCSLGSLEVFFDQTQLSQDGAKAVIDCSLGAIVMFVPKHWRLEDNIGCSLGGVELDDRFYQESPDAPCMTLTGQVSLGSVEIRRV